MVLQSRPGPALGEGQRVVEHPLMAEHFAFLDRRRADGSLIAEGPFSDVDGEGMVILGTISYEQARQLAEHDDQSVVRGLLSVVVRPWTVLSAPVADG